MFILFGVKTINKSKGQRNEFCPNCKKETMHSIILRKKYFDLFFIPIFPIGRKKMINKCNLCGYSRLIN
jgi:hypothetical protein